MPIAQLVEHIKDHSKLGKPASLELTLTPEDLGKIRLVMTPDGDKIRVVIQAERPETMELLKRNTEGFTAELRQSGYASASFSFGGWGNPPSSQQNQDQTQPPDSGSTPTGDATEKPAIPQQFAAPHKSSVLDLRI